MVGGAEGRSGTRATRTYKYRGSGGVGATTRSACNLLFCQELGQIPGPGKGLPTDYTDCPVPVPISLPGHRHRSPGKFGGPQGAFEFAESDGNLAVGLSALPAVAGVPR